MDYMNAYGSAAPLTSPGGEAFIGGLLGGTMTILIIVAIVWGILNLIANWRIFTKAGEPGWKVLIPIYNAYTQYKFTWTTQMFFVLLILTLGGTYLTVSFADNEILTAVGTLMSLLGSLISLLSCHKLSLAFGHGIGFTLGLIFLQPIFIMILGFGSSQYQGNPTQGNRW